MNKERILALADRIEASSPGEFNMQDWFEVNPKLLYGWWGTVGVSSRLAISYVEVDTIDLLLEKECGTTACVAGFAILLYPQEAKDIILSSGRYSLHVERIAAQILDLSTYRADELFRYNPHYGSKDLKKVTKFEIAEHLRWLANTAE